MIRISREKGYLDRLRKYKVILDGSVCGNIKAGETKDFHVNPGIHTISLKIDWCTSDTLEFHVPESGIVEFECGTSGGGGIMDVTFSKNKYLWIRMR